MSDETSVPHGDGSSGRFAFAVWIAFALLTCVALFAGLVAYLNRDVLVEREFELGLPASSAEVVAATVAGRLADEIGLLEIVVAEGDLRLALEGRNQLYRGTDEVIRGIISDVDAAWRSAFASAVAPPRPIADNAGARALRRYSRMRPALEVSLVVDQYGAATASTEILGQYDFSNEGWFRNTLATGESAIVPSADVEFGLVLPMPGNSPTPRGVFWAEIDSSVLVADAVAELGPLGVSVAVVDRSGRLVYPAAESGSALPDAVLLEAAGRGLAGPARLETASGTVFAATSRVPDQGVVDVGSDLGWTVLVWRPKTDVEPANRAWIEQRLSSLWIALGAVALFALLAAAWLSRPLSRVRRVASAASAGAAVAHPSRTGIFGVRSDGLASLLGLAGRAGDLEAEVHWVRRGLNRWLESDDAGGRTAESSAASTPETTADLLARVDQQHERREMVLQQIASDAEQLKQAPTPRQVQELASRLREQQQRLEGVSSFLSGLAAGSAGLPAAVREEIQRWTNDSASSASAPVGVDDEMTRVSAGVSRAVDLVDRIGVLALNASIKAALGPGSAELGEIVSEIEDLGRHTREHLAESAETLERWLAEPEREKSKLIDSCPALRGALEDEAALEESVRDPLAAVEAALQLLEEASGQCERLAGQVGDHLWVEAVAIERIHDRVAALSPKTSTSATESAAAAESDSSGDEAGD